MSLYLVLTEGKQEGVEQSSSQETCGMEFKAVFAWGGVQ